MKKYVLQVLILSLLLSGCHLPGRHADEDPKQPVYGFKWYLQKIHLPGGDISIQKSNAFISFDTAKRAVSGNGGCNSFGGNCRMKGKEISISELFSTEMYCAEYQSQEDVFFRKLQEVNRFEVKDGQLFLYRDNELLMEFRK